MVTRYGSPSLYDLVSHSGSKSHLVFVDFTLTKLEGVADNSTTLAKTYSISLIYYLVPLELDHVDHASTVTFATIKVSKVDLTAIK